MLSGSTNEAAGEEGHLATIIAVVALVVGAGTSLLVWTRGGALASRLRTVAPLALVHRLFANLWFFDRLQDLVVVRGGLAVARWLRIADLGTPRSAGSTWAGPSLDGVVDGVARTTRLIGRGGNTMLTGRLNLYLGYAVALAAVALLIWWEQ